MTMVCFSELLRDKTVERLAHRLIRRVTKHLFGCGIEKDNILFAVHRDDGVHCRVYYPGELLLAGTKSFHGPPAFGDIESKDTAGQSFFKFQLIGRYLDIN